MEYLGSGRGWTAGLCIVAAVWLTAFLASLTDARVRPLLIVSTAGIVGRMPRGRRVRASWDEVTTDAAGVRSVATRGWIPRAI